jgi:hypothetical protein
MPVVEVRPAADPRHAAGPDPAIRWPASSRSRYVRIELADGRKLSALPRPRLMDFINGVRAVSRLASAFSGVNPNTPIPARAGRDY